MSLLPYYVDDFGFRHHRPLLDHHFGHPLTPDDLVTAGKYCRPWHHLAAPMRAMSMSPVGHIKKDKNKFEINLDVQHFTPEEITVKATDGYVVVEGKHEEKQDDHGYVARQFVRRYALPEGTALDTVESKLSSDGVLTVTAPRVLPDAVQGERLVPIAQTGPVRKVIKDHHNVCTDEKKALK